jgi:hypothetical protein
MPDQTFVDRLLQATPSWLIGLVVFLLMLAAAWWGTRLRRTHRSAGLDGDAATREGYIVSGVVGLLALLLGFTFGLAVDRFDARRLLVLDAANAIRTAWLQSQTFGEPHRTALGGLFVNYADNRLAAGSTGDPDEAIRLMAEGRALRGHLWSTSLAAIAGQRDDISSAYMGSVNRLLEVGAARLAARETHVPSRVFVILFVYMIVTALILGFVIGGRHWPSVIVLLLLTTMAYGLIFDMDGATDGAVRESQQPMRDLRAEPPPPPGG